MLRRIARVLRIGLFGSGIAVLGCLAFSFFFEVWLISPWPAETTAVHISSGAVGLLVVTERHPEIPLLEFGLPGESGAYLAFTRSRPTLQTLRPRFVTVHDVGFEASAVLVPLWLLAFICLAWPVTSFIIHRRRHKRGFPVEPKGAGDSVNTSAS